MALTATAVNLIIADSTMVRVIYPYRITVPNDCPVGLAVLGCMGSQLESNNPSNLPYHRRYRYAAL